MSLRDKLSVSQGQIGYLGGSMIKNILGINAFFMINKKIVEKCGFESALFLAILADAKDVFDAEWMYQTIPTVEKLSCGFLTRKKQDKAIKNLIELGVIQQKNLNMPPKRHFKINKDELLAVLSDN